MNQFILTDEEFKSLLDYFLHRAGFISHEFDHGIWLLIQRMINYYERHR